jgi:hypothetical protein
MVAREIIQQVGWKVDFWGERKLIGGGVFEDGVDSGCGDAEIYVDGAGDFANGFELGGKPDGS